MVRPVDGWPGDELGIEGQVLTDGDRSWRKGPDPFGVEVPQDTPITGVQGSGIIFSGTAHGGASVVDGRWLGVPLHPESDTQEGQQLPTAVTDSPPAFLQSIWYKYETTLGDDPAFQALRVTLSGQGTGGPARNPPQNFITAIQEDILLCFKRLDTNATYTTHMDIVGGRDFTDPYFSPVSLGDQVSLQQFLSDRIQTQYQVVLMRRSFRNPADPLLSLIHI